MDELLLAEAAEIAGVRPNTWSSYVARGQAPAPTRRVGRTPLWSEDDVRQWVASRPGQGSRSTLRARSRAEQRQSKDESEAD